MNVKATFNERMKLAAAAAETARAREYLSQVVAAVLDNCEGKALEAVSDGDFAAVARAQTLVLLAEARERALGYGVQRRERSQSRERRRRQ